MKKKLRSLSVSFAGEFFNIKHLIGNACPAEAAYGQSHGRRLCAPAQDVGSRGTTPRAIRNHHARQLDSAPTQDVFVGQIRKVFGLPR